MQTVKASTYGYKIIRSNPDAYNPPRPLLKSSGGKELMYCISPHHGRSFVVERNKAGRCVISKGNGLGYSGYQNLYSGEYDDNTWGILLPNDAIRDFDMGMTIAELGIKTNVMEYVLELDTKTLLPNGHQLTPFLLQYSVECPYRICDAAYMPKKEINKQVEKWHTHIKRTYAPSYLIAAEVLIENLRTLHDHNILHNAIHYQNYTWALELLDFELACCPSYPYNNEEAMTHVKELFNREVIQTYEVINHIAWCLCEDIDYNIVDNIFRTHGFDLSQMSV